MLKVNSLIAAGSWLLLVSAGMSMLLGYSLTPGDSGSAAKSWPSESELKLATDRATVVVALHPGCACSNATIAQYERVVAQITSDVTTYFLVNFPAQKPELWNSYNQKSRLAHIPGAQVIKDHDGKITRRFGLETSGHTLLYNKLGQLLFNGGITNGRGHEGTNLADSYLKSLINGEEADFRSFPVFGCNLFSNHDQQS